VTPSLDGRRILVAGAGGSLGPVVVRALAQAGAAPVAVDVSADRLDEARALGAEVHGADLGSDDGAKALAAAVGPVDGVLHLVGGWRGGTPADELALADLELLELLLWRTVVHTSRAFLPALRAAGAHGRFALVSSAQAQRPDPGNAAYAATKAAAETWTLALAGDLATTGGTANVVVVNALVTPAMREAEPDRAFKTFTDDDEVAEALVYVCSDAARKMNGKRLELHGG
jgi:NAD(P)-dependent dehydrogenase (short-subunit alcohol dehydrogenase family)